MRAIEQTAAFKRDLKREARGRHRIYLKSNFTVIVAQLAMDEPLAARFYDHALAGNWQGFRDCHIRPDLILIYQKPNESALKLVRLGSHTELSL